MNKSQRIKLSTDNKNKDKYFKIRLEENVDTIEFLSMNIKTSDVYQDFNADYGVLVGRVLANGKIGVPNAKISIFIPLTDEDANNGQIYSIYPYRTPRDKNLDGKRYNLLPRVGKFDKTTGQSSPKQPFGSFPIKEEIVTNQSFLDVYKKYYKYTTTTNNSGDYMIFGVPTGTQTVHLSVDITDIGEYSMTPASMVTNLGYSPNLFMENNTKIKPSNDLNDLPHIETQEISVDIIPFWGDTENFEIGITQQNFRIRSTLVNTFVIFGSAFTDGDNSMWGTSFGSGTRIDRMFRAVDDANLTIGMCSKRIGNITEKVYYYPTDVSDSEIDGGVDPRKYMSLMNSSEYSIYKRDGDFVLIINCNRGKVVTDDYGNKTPVDDSSPSGVFTKFRGFITLEISTDDIPMNFTGKINDKDSLVTPIRYKLKFPQYATPDKSFDKYETYTQDWRKQHYTFEAGKFYSIARFHGTTANSSEEDSHQNSTSPYHHNVQTNDSSFLGETLINYVTADPYWNVGIIAASSYQSYNNGDYQFPALDNGLFGATWMNLCAYLPQIGYLRREYSKIAYIRCADNFTKQVYQSGGDNYGNTYFLDDNNQEIVGGDFNTRWFARSDLHWTDFIEVPIIDIKNMNNIPIKGFTNNDLQLQLQGVYHNGTYKPNNWPSAVPIDGNTSTNKYFYKGFGTSDCIKYLFELGIIN